ncbi:MAG: phytoene desaturase [Calditrichaceae bacterium]|nr:phytoene desaturase [Calditrichaceae bacterium]RQV92972.1 MAG: phytoene desaturase [Calditrichota bacterium]
MPKAIVIGSGFGGLSTAIRLQAKGFNVTILEKQKKTGGRAYQLKKNGYTFDMGPSLITAPEILSRVFESAGKSMDKYLELIKLEPAYRIYFHDKTYIDYTGDSDKMKEQMRKFNPDDAEKYDAFMEKSGKLYDAVITDGLGSTPFDSLQFMLKLVPRLFKMNAVLPVYSYAKRYFKDPRHRFTFSFHPLFIGGNPFRTPSVYLMIPYLEKKGGVWFTKGGMYSVVQALEKVFKEIGGTVATESEAEEILTENGKAVGVRAGNELYPADIVVSNADLAHTYKDLIDKKDRKKYTDRRLLRMDYSMSAFLLYLGVKKQYPQLLHHTLILSERYRGLVDDIFDNKILPQDQSMYLHVPTRTDPSMAPEKCESMYVLVPVANLEANINWSEKKQDYAKHILNFLEHDFGLEELQENLEIMEIFTPQDFAIYQNAYLGSAWGVEPRLLQSAYFRPHNKSEDVENLYFVGASTHPGAGVPGVLLTAEATEYAIMRDMEKQNSKLKSA